MKKLLLLLTLMLSCNFMISAAHLHGCEADNLANGAARIWLNETNGTIKFVELAEPTFVQPNHMEAWLQNLLKTNDETGFELYEAKPDKLGYVHFRFRQTYDGIPVNNAVYYIHTFQGNIVSANGDFYPEVELNVSPVITLEGAIAIGKEYIHGHRWAWPEDEFPTPELHVDRGEDGYHLTYKTDIYSVDPIDRRFLMIDVVSGEVIAEYNRIHNNSVPGEVHCKYHGVQTAMVDSISPTEFRLRDDTRGGGVETYDMNEGTDYFSAVDFTDSDNVWTNTANQDDAALDAHWGTQGMYDYMLNVHGFESYDGNGSTMLSYVHYSSNFSNAFWDGQRMTYGDGDGTDWLALTSTEVVGHEIMHGVTENTAGLIYSGESGALNESYSDCFGVILDFQLNPMTANYRMGDDFMPVLLGLRNMGDPNEFNNPDTYLGDFWNAGGVHNQSGVQNFWFYLLTEGGTGTNDNNDDYIVNPIPMADAADILFRSLTVYLTPNSPYADARFYGIQSATELFGDCTDQVIGVTNAWHAVGVGGLFDDAVQSAFIASSNFNCQTPATIQFNNTSINASSYVWDFGNGTTSTLSNPTATYDMPGTYTVSLIASGNALCGNSDTTIIVDYITVTNDGGPASPSCFPGTTAPLSGSGLFNFTFETINNTTSGGEEGYQDYTCTHSTNVMEGIIYPFSVQTGVNENIRIWFDADNDGVFNNTNELIYTSFEPANVHDGVLIIPDTDIYGEPLRLRIKSDVDGNDITNSCTTVSNGQVEDYTIVVSENVQAPLTDFVASETTVLLGTSVNFTDLTQNLPENWSWEFPGGIPATSTLQNPTVVYNTLGVYPVTLTATNSLGQDVELKTSYISVVSTVEICSTPMTTAPSGIFYDSGGPNGPYSNNEFCTFLIDPGCALDITMTFTEFNVESGFDDLAIYDGIDQSAPLIGIYSGSNAPGTIVATSGKMFFVFDSDGSVTPSGWAADWVSSAANTLPTGDFTISDPNPPLNVPVVFTDESTEFPSSWVWTFGDGSVSTAQNPTHTYTAPGTYDVELIVGNCFDFDTVMYSLVVQAPPVVEVNPLSIYELVDCGDSTEVSLTITNTGQGDLVFDTGLEGEAVSETSSMVFDAFNNFTTHSFSGISSGADSLFLEITLNGDFDNTTEFASLYIDGNFILEIEDLNPTNGIDAVVNYAFGETDIAAWVSDGVVEVYLENSLNVDDDQGGTNTHTVTLQTNGSSWLSADPLDGVVAAGSSETVTVYLNSADLAAGIYTNEIELATNDATNPVITIPVTMEVVGEAEITFSETCLDFPSTMQYATSSLDVMITNDGCDTLMVSDIFPDNSIYSASATQLEILPHESAMITISFTPTTVGSFPSNMNFASNIPTAALCLTGTSFGAPAASINPSSVDVTLNCGASTTVDLILSNSGLSDLEYQAILGGQEVSETSVMVFDQLNSFTNHVFNDISSGTDSLFLEITLNGDFDNISEYASLYIDGNYLFDIEDLNPTNGTDAVVNYAFGEADIASWVSDGVVEVYLENSTNVDDDQGGTNTHTVTIQTNASIWASVSPEDGTVGTGANTILTVDLTSVGLPAGTYTEELEILTNDPLNPILVVPVTMEVVGEAAISFSVSCLNFPPTVQYTTSTMDLVVNNDGCGVLDINDIFANDSEYTVTSPQLEIEPFGSAVVTVSFTPTTVGSFPSDLYFISNIPDADVCLTGTSLGAPAASVNPTSIDLSLDCGDATTVDIVLSNNGLSSLEYEASFGGVAISETSAIVFDQFNSFTNHVFNNVSSNTDSIFLEITLNGDFDNFSEFASLYIDGNYLFDIEDLNPTNGVDAIVNYAFGGPDVATWVSDGVVNIYLENSLNVDDDQGGTNTHTVTFEVNGSSWLSVSPTDGTVGTNSNNTLTVDITTDGLQGGTHMDELEIMTNDPLNPTITIPVTLEVTGLCADYVYNLPIACGGQVDFTSSVVNSPTTYLWNFGDGNTSTAANPTHIYSSPGNYTVTLTVENGSDSDVVTYVVAITEVGAPQEACIVGSVDVTPTFDITRVELNTIDNPNPNTSNGYTDYTCDWNTNLIIGVAYDITVEGYDFDEENVRVWIDLDNSGTFESSELMYEVMNELSPHQGQITIPSAGTILGVPLRMRVACDAWYNNVPSSCIDLGTGEFEDYTVTIESNTAPPIAGFNFDFIDNCQGVVQFNDQSSNLPTSWSWDFGDGSAGSTLQNPIHVFPAAGIYIVTLTATNDFGTNAYNITVTINSLNPIIQYVGVPEPNTTLTFQSNSPDAISWSWNFGDGNGSTDEFPTHQYASIGTYLVTLTVENSDGCIATTNEDVTIVISGVDELEGAISLFPNPTSGDISIKNTSTERYFEIEVVNTIGQVVKRIDTSNHIGDTYYLELENFAPGMYVIELKFADNQVLQRKFVLQPKQ